jgi:SAM-dependent methyltransferase
MNLTAPPITAPTSAPAAEETRPYFEIANLEIPRIMDGLPNSLDVLDVGCGSGVHGAELKRIHQHNVTGVDLSEESIRRASTRLAAAYVADITRPDDYPFATGPGFDVILFSDILEHIYDPVTVLRSHLKLLKPGGYVLISLPNVAIWNVRLELLFGRFRYQDTGTLDRTHIRFFNQRSFRELLASCDLKAVRSRITPGILRPFVPVIKRVYGRGSAPQANSPSIMDSRPYQLYCRRFYPLERLVCQLRPNLLAFQFVALCQPGTHRG